MSSRTKDTKVMNGNCLARASEQTVEGCETEACWAALRAAWQQPNARCKRHMEVRGACTWCFDCCPDAGRKAGVPTGTS